MMLNKFLKTIEFQGFNEIKCNYSIYFKSIKGGIIMGKNVIIGMIKRR